jgi:exosortase/archaeosortase family protein
MHFPKIIIPEKLKPFKSVVIFAIILMGSNLFWKYNVIGDEAFLLDSFVTIWGYNVSAPFIWMAKHVADISVVILNGLGSDVILLPGNIFRHTTGYAVQIVWACTGIKQMYIFFCIIAFYRGPWLRKLWYIPLGLFVVYLFNVFRIAFIIGVVEFRPDLFHFLHMVAFKYAFYFIIFLMWVLWEEKIAGKTKEIKSDPAE